MPFVPDTFVVPPGLVTDQFRLEPLGPQHNAADYATWTSSIDHITATPGFADWDWPDSSLTIEDNLADLVQHEKDFAERIGFTYTVLSTVLDPQDDVIGCVYLYPSDQPGSDVHVRSWVRRDHADLDEPLWRAVTAWLAADWPFEAPEYAPR
jgi:hypothetical protein